MSEEYPWQKDYETKQEGLVEIVAEIGKLHSEGETNAALKSLPSVAGQSSESTTMGFVDVTMREAEIDKEMEELYRAEQYLGGLPEGGVSLKKKGSGKYEGEGKSFGLDVDAQRIADELAKMKMKRVELDMKRVELDAVTKKVHDATGAAAVAMNKFKEFIITIGGILMHLRLLVIAGPIKKKDQQLPLLLLKELNSVLIKWDLQTICKEGKRLTLKLQWVPKWTNDNTDVEAMCERIMPITIMLSELVALARKSKERGNAAEIQILNNIVENGKLFMQLRERLITPEQRAAAQEALEMAQLSLDLDARRRVDALHNVSTKHPGGVGGGSTRRKSKGKGKYRKSKKCNKKSKGKCGKSKRHPKSRVKRITRRVRK